MIKLENVSKYYHNNKLVTMALNNISLELNKGEFVAITGESGSGKTTLLNVISGLDYYENGEMYINGKPTSHYSSEDWSEYRKNNIGFIFQNYNLIEGYTVLDNVISALVINEINLDDAKQQAIEILDKVGLEDRYDQRAAKLSSGQKQRLSIARALAKNTDIIVADEPTGNLDSENGTKIMELLYKLSKDKLVIVVTHNIEQIEGLATRKIKMFDGCISTDQVIRTVAKEKDSEDQKNDLQASIAEKVQKKRNNTIRYILRFVKNNIKANPKRVMTIFVLLLIGVVSSFIFTGIIGININDSIAKTYTKTSFFNDNEKRLVVRNIDGSAITDEQIKEFEKIHNVRLVNKYGISNDINYYYRKGIDFEYDFAASTAEINQNAKIVAEEIDIRKVEDSPQFLKILKTNNFIISSGNMTQADLSAGRLPTEYNEIAIYSNDKSYLNKKLLFYFRNEYNWQEDIYAYMNMKVVGILKEETEQVYFSEKLAYAFSATNHTSDFKKLNMESYTGRNTYNDNIIIMPYRDYKEEADDDIAIMSDEMAKLFFVTYQARMFINEYSELGDNEPINTINLDNVSTKYHYSSKYFIYVGEKLFNRIYNSVDSYQASLYVTNENYVNQAINTLKNMNYEAVCPNLVAKGDYVLDKVRDRLIILIICIFALVIIFILELIIVKMLLKFNKDDILILKFIGLSNKMLCSINYTEMLLYLGSTIVIALAMASIANALNISIIPSIISNYTFYGYLAFIILNLLVALISVYDYNKYLCKKSRITALGED